MIKAEVRSSRPEAAFVLVVLQSLFWAAAGLSAIPFALGGEHAMLGLGIASLLLALGVAMAAIGLLWRRRWARRVLIVLEVMCLLATLIMLVVPIGANHGLVSWIVNAALPAAVIVLLRKAF